MKTQEIKPAVIITNMKTAETRGLNAHTCMHANINNLETPSTIIQLWWLKDKKKEEKKRKERTGKTVGHDQNSTHF